MDFIGERTIMGLTSESKGQTLLIGAACLILCSREFVLLHKQVLT